MGARPHPARAGFYARAYRAPGFDPRSITDVPDKTLLVYDQPIASLRFPLEQGDYFRECSGEIGRRQRSCCSGDCTERYG